jgi:hypothetical protein
MFKIRLTISLLALLSVLTLSACGTQGVATAEADQYANLLEHEQKTLEQAKVQQETLKKTSTASSSHL